MTTKHITVTPDEGMDERIKTQNTQLSCIRVITDRQQIFIDIIDMSAGSSFVTMLIHMRVVSSERNDTSRYDSKERFVTLYR